MQNWHDGLYDGNQSSGLDIVFSEVRIPVICS